MNACTFCKNGKRKCDKGRPSCSNCLRLRKACAYTEDALQTKFAPPARSHGPPFEVNGVQITQLLAGIRPFSLETLQQSTINIALQILGSVDNMLAISNEFFTGTHQRTPVLSKYKFLENLQSLTTQPKADFTVLCLCILLVQQTPDRQMSRVQSPLYFTIKSLISLLETTNEISFTLLHCRIIITFYEMGHGLRRVAYVSVAACARMARSLGLHRKAWRNVEAWSDKIALEEEKRMWWAILNMERFIGLCSGDALFMTADPHMTDPIPIQDLEWAECLVPADLEILIAAAPAVNTPANINVGQMARECQVVHLAGRVVRNLFDPTSDLNFNSEEALQLERTLKSYIPLLAMEELRIGKYCAGFGICNSALFILYEVKLNNSAEQSVERQQALQSMEETSISAFEFANAAYADVENYPDAIRSPYLPYSLFQAAIVQYRIWKQTSNLACHHRYDKLRIMLRDYGNRWMVAAEYFEILDHLNENWPSLVLPSQGLFISTGRSKF